MINLTNTVVVTVGTASQMKTVQMTGLVLNKGWKTKSSN